MALAPQELRRLVALCERLGSDFDGERAAAALLVTRFLAQHNVSWSDVLHAEAAVVVVSEHRGWRQCADDLLQAHQPALTDWEASFLASILGRGHALTERQSAVLLRIAAKCGVPGW